MKKGVGIFCKGADQELEDGHSCFGAQRSNNRSEVMIWRHAAGMIEYSNANYSKSGIDRNYERSYRVCTV